MSESMMCCFGLWWWWLLNYINFAQCTFLYLKKLCMTVWLLTHYTDHGHHAISICTAAHDSCSLNSRIHGDAKWESWAGALVKVSIPWKRCHDHGNS